MFPLGSYLGSLKGSLGVPSTLRCRATWLVACASDYVLSMTIKFQGLIPQGCQVITLRTHGSIMSFCLLSAHVMRDSDRDSVPRYIFGFFGSVHLKCTVPSPAVPAVQYRNTETAVLVFFRYLHPSYTGKKVSPVARCRIMYVILSVMCYVAQDSEFDAFWASWLMNRTKQVKNARAVGWNSKFSVEKNQTNN